MKYVREPVIRVDADAITSRLYAPISDDAVDLPVKARLDACTLLVQLDELRAAEWDVRSCFADLLAAARTAVAAQAIDEPDSDYLSKLRSLVLLHSEITDAELDEWRDLDRYRPPTSTNSDPDRKEAPTN